MAKEYSIPDKGQPFLIPLHTDTGLLNPPPTFSIVETPEYKSLIHEIKGSPKPKALRDLNK